MSVATVYVVRLTCDGCGKTTDASEGGAAEMRLQAAINGWTFIDYKRKHVDICPDCDRAKVMAHLREVWQARLDLLADCPRNGCRLAYDVKWKAPCQCLLNMAGGSS